MPQTQSDAPKKPIDVLVHARWIAAVDPANTVHENASLAIDGNTIVGIYPQQEARQRFSAEKNFTLDTHLLCPGLVNAHGHAAMTLFRGFADDLPLMTWLTEHIWPAETAHVDAGFVEVGASLAAAEMLRSGTTCFSDMYFYPGVTAAVAHRHGLRTQLAFPVLELETAWAKSLQEYIDKGLQVLDDYKHSAYVDVCFGPHAPYTVSRETLLKVLTLAEEIDAGVHMHVHESEQEIQAFVHEHGQRPLAMLHEIGLASPRLCCAHMCHVDDTDLEILSTTGTHVAHCPRANLKLASGFSPIQKLLQAGVNVALGTDGAASNNRLDMLNELTTSALLAKGVAGEAHALNAVQALRQATINGARALGKDADIGSLEAGKQADCFAIDLDQPEYWPLYDPIAQLVYCANSQHISHVWSAGELRLEGGRLLNFNLTELRNQVNQWRNVLRQ